MASDRTRTGRRIDIEFDGRYNIDVSRVDAGVLWRITAMAFRNRWRMALGIVAALAAGFFQLFVPQFLGRAVDEAQGLLGGGISRDLAGEALMTTAMLLIATSVLRGLFAMVQNYQGESVGQIIGYDLRMAYYRQLQIPEPVVARPRSLRRTDDQGNPRYRGCAPLGGYRDPAVRAVVDPGCRRRHPACPHRPGAGNSWPSGSFPSLP